MSTPKHYNPLLITVLPKERRSRHPYQIAAMLTLLTLGLWQVAFGAAAISTVDVLDETAYQLLNCVCALAGGAGIAAALIPERIVRLQLPLRFFNRTFKTEFDATYFRLWEEFGCHILLLSIWAAYGQTIWDAYGLVKSYSLGLAFCVMFGGAAIARAVQIFLTMWRARTFHRDATAIVSTKTLGDKYPEDGEL